MFTSVASPPFVGDLGMVAARATVRTSTTWSGCQQALNAVHIFGGYPVEPTDVHASVRHLHATRSLLTLSDKVPHVYSLGAQRNIDCLEMVRIARQVDDATLDRRAVGAHGRQRQLAAALRRADA